MCEWVVLTSPGDRRLDGHLEADCKATAQRLAEALHGPRVRVQSAIDYALSLEEAKATQRNRRLRIRTEEEEEEP